VAVLGERGAAKKIAAANDNRHLRPEFADAGNPLGNGLDCIAFDAESAGLAETLFFYP
jgi:hypothetical protein